KLERLSWGLFLQIMIFIALLAGLIHSEWALGLLIWLARKIKNMLIRLQIDYHETIDDFIVQLQKAGKKIKIAVKILCLIFISLILASIILLLWHQPVYAALCVLILAIGPFLLAHALSAAALDLIAMPIAGLAAWLLLIAFNFIVWPPGTIMLGWRLSILILLMLISSVFVISGRKTRGLPLVLAITLSVSIMIYSSSSFLQAVGHKLGGKFAIGTASSNRWAGADQRKAEAIREFTKGIVIEDGLFRDKDNPQNTKKAVKNMSVLIEYQSGKPIRPEPVSELSRQFKGSFCKVYLPDQNGSFPKTGQGWWIEDIKIQDTKLFVPRVSKGGFAKIQAASTGSASARTSRRSFAKSIVLKGPSIPSEAIDLNRYPAYRVNWWGPDNAKVVLGDGRSGDLTKNFGTITGRVWFQGPAGATVTVVFTPR
ncbi:MAG: hypothetical protein ABIG90_02950, partial [bacterium]